MRKLVFLILAAVVASTAVAGDAFAARTYDRFSVAGISGYAWQEHSDVKDLVDYWNMIMRSVEGEQVFGDGTADEIGDGYSLLLDVRYRLSPRFLMAMRLEYITGNSTSIPLNIGAEFSAAGVPITLTGIYEIPGLFPGFLEKMKLNVGAGGGVVMRGVHKFQFYAGVNEMLTVRSTDRGFQLHTSAELEYPVLKRLALTAEILYRYTRMGDLTIRSVSGESPFTRQIWGGSDDPPQDGIFSDVPFPSEGNMATYWADREAMQLDFSGFNFHFGLRFYAW